MSSSPGEDPAGSVWTGPAPTGSVWTGPAPTGSASTGPAPTGSASTGPAPTGSACAVPGAGGRRVARRHTGRRRNEAALDAILDVTFELLRSQDADDAAYRLLWHRLPAGHAPLDARAARDLGARLIAAGRG